MPTSAKVSLIEAAEIGDVTALCNLLEKLKSKVTNDVGTLCVRFVCRKKSQP